MEEKKPLRVVAGLVFWDRRLLIGRRPANKDLGGYWEFPGGKVAPGETDEAALHRELMEEVGIRVEGMQLFESVCHRYSFREIDLRFFACRWKSGDARPIECDAVSWVEQGQLRDYRFPEADARILQRLTDEACWWA